MNTEMLAKAIGDAVREAGKMLRAAHAEKEEIAQKEGPVNFVTVYDVKIQNFLQERLKILLPEAQFLGEEGEKEHCSWEGYTFIIDPIDGTTNFIFHYHHSCVSVALAWKKQLQMGFVYNPYLDEMFWAAKGMGAWLNHRRLLPENRKLEEGIAAFGCARYNSGDTNRIFAMARMLYDRSASLREGGSAAIDLSWIAAGRNCLYIELLLHPWDYAAAAIIIEEAGGRITQWDGSPVTLDASCSVLAGLPSAWEETGQLIRELDKGTF